MLLAVLGFLPSTLNPLSSSMCSAVREEPRPDKLAFAEPAPELDLCFFMLGWPFAELFSLASSLSLERLRQPESTERW